MRLQRYESVPHSVSRQDFPNKACLWTLPGITFVQKVQIILVRMEKVSAALRGLSCDPVTTVMRELQSTSLSNTLDTLVCEDGFLDLHLPLSSLSILLMIAGWAAVGRSSRPEQASMMR